MLTSWLLKSSNSRTHWRSKCGIQSSRSMTQTQFQIFLWKLFHSNLNTQLGTNPQPSLSLFPRWVPLLQSYKKLLDLANQKKRLQRVSSVKCLQNTVSLWKPFVWSRRNSFSKRQLRPTSLLWRTPTRSLSRSYQAFKRSWDSYSSRSRSKSSQWLMWSRASPRAEITRASMSLGQLSKSRSESSQSWCQNSSKWRHSKEDKWLDSRIDPAVR